MDGVKRKRFRRSRARAARSDSSPSPDLAPLAPGARQWHLPAPAPATVTRQRLKDLATLARRKGRRQHGQFLVEGVRSVEAAVQAGAPLVEVLVAEDLGNPRVQALAERADVPVHRVPAHELAKVGDARSSQGVVAVARSVVTDAAPAEGPVLLLDGVQDPGNVGALVRTAAWFGVAAVVLDHASADPESPKAVRASMGGIWDLKLSRVPSLVPVLEALGQSGTSAWGADLSGTPAHRWSPSANAALVMGSEAHGLSEPVAAWLRQRPPAGGRFVCIESGRGEAPPSRGVESLNVAVAGGVLLARWLGASGPVRA